MDARANVLGADAPDFTADEAQDLALALFGVRGAATALVSERDQNFRLTDADGVAWVLKISNGVEDPAVVDMEVEAVRHVARMDPTLPVAVPRLAENGVAAVRVPGRDGSAHQVRLIPFLPGRHVEPSSLSPAALREVGRVTARVGRALRGFFHPAAGRTILWDLKHLDALRPHLDAVTDPARRAMVERALERYDRFVAPALPTLRAQVIHNDLTLDNLLLDGDRVTGILDFGDMAHTALALDLPAMLQSVLRGRSDLFEAADEAIARLRGGDAARDGGGGPPRRPARRAHGADGPHLGVADGRIPRQRVHHRLDGAGVRAARAAGGGRLGHGRPQAGGTGPRSGVVRGHSEPGAGGIAGGRCSGQPCRRSPTSGRSTWFGARACGCSTRRDTDSSMPTTTSRWWAMRTKPW